MEPLLQALHQQFLSNFQLEQVRSHVHQLYIPAYYPDGDMMDIYIEQTGKDAFRVCDYGTALMRLSYTYELNSERKKKILLDILHENGADFEDGNIFIETPLSRLDSAVMQFVQILSQVSSMRQYQRTVEQTAFYEEIHQFIYSRFLSFKPRQNVTPLQGSDEYVVDYVLAPKEKRPVFLFPVSGQSKTQTVVITLQQLQQCNIPFTGVVIHRDFEKLPGKTQKFITNAADKQFADFKSFADGGPRYIERLLAV